MRKIIKSISTRKLRSNLANVLEDVKRRMDRYIISRRGEPTAILMCVDDYEGWLETLEIMSSKSAMADIKKAKRELAEGKFCTFQEAFGNNGRSAKRLRR